MSSVASGTAVDSRVAAFLLDRFGEGPATLSLAALAGDASTRRYFRVATGRETFVLALYPEPFDVADMPFAQVRDLLSAWGLPVPRILDHDGARGVLLLDDLGDLTLQEVLRTACATECQDLYREALDALVRLQGEAARHGHREAPCFHVAFDIEKLTWELHYFEKHFLEGHRACDLSVEDRAVLAESFHRLCEEITCWPRVLCHRDFHSRNLMAHAGRLHWIDFQDARMGPVTYDLASLLRDSYVDLPEEFVAARAEEFRQRAVAGEAPEHFLRRFELTCVQRNLKALGTFGFMASVRGNPVYLPYIPRTLAHAGRNLARHPELLPLRRVLAKHVEELS